MPLTPEQRQTQLNRWREGFMSAHPELTQQQRDAIMALDQIPGLADYTVETTLMRDDYGRFAQQTREREEAAAAAAAAAERRTAEVNAWYAQNAPVVQQQQTELNRAQAALIALQNTYQIPAEEMNNYTGGQPVTGVRPPAPGYAPAPAPAYPPSTSQTQQPQAPAFDPRAFQSQIIDGVVSSIGEFSSINARHTKLTGEPLDAAPIMEHMKRNPSAYADQGGFERAWREVHNISAIEQAAVAAATAAREAEIRADERTRIAQAQASGVNPNPQFEQARISSALNIGGAGADDGEQHNHHGRTAAATAAYVARQQARNNAG
jgi:hypothetical protein